MTSGKIRLASMTAHDLPDARIVTLGLAAVVVTAVLLAGPARLYAQHGGGGRGGGTGINGASSRPIICVYDCRDLSPGADLTGKDLKNFESLVAAQATAEQSGAFAKVLQDSQDAEAQLKAFRELAQKVPASEQLAHRDTLDQALEKARTTNQNFLASFSQAQKSGLKNITAKLLNADAGLAKEIKGLNEIVPRPNSENIASLGASLDRALSGFRGEQLALGRAMSILPSEGQDLTFHLPQVTSSVEIVGQSLSIPAAVAVMRTSTADGRNFFNVRFVTDLSDLQDNVADILRSQLSRAPRCGERVEVKQATLLPQSEASLAVVQLHHERWFCAPGEGRESSERLLASDEASVEVKLSPTVETGGALHLVSEMGRVEAKGFLRDSIQSGSLGAALREQISDAVLSVIAKGADLRPTLPPAARDVVTMQKARFEDAGAGQLALVVDGQLQLSDEQTKQFAMQLRQQLSAQAKAPQ